jgi:hypothetical protein
VLKHSDCIAVSASGVEALVTQEKFEREPGLSHFISVATGSLVLGGLHGPSFIDAYFVSAQPYRQNYQPLVLTQH